ncbi:MAG: hypothetical protein K6T80_01205 [Firmicutes bacterium]|nr:hypothetical protein [Bacillota bacterium]
MKKFGVTGQAPLVLKNLQRAAGFLPLADVPADLLPAWNQLCKELLKNGPAGYCRLWGGLCGNLILEEVRLFAPD